MLALAAMLTAPAHALPKGELAGTVSLRETGGPVDQVSVTIVELGLTTLTDGSGAYRFGDVPSGTYHVVAHLDQLFVEAAKMVTIQPGSPAALDFSISLVTHRQEINVTVSEKRETPFEAFQDVETLNASDLAEMQGASLGEVLDHMVGSGVAKRSFGPGHSRPIIRGFDGDRVLMMEDGISTGTLSATSGDHGEVTNVGQIDRLEIVKGPSTLLYSGSAMGGTVNAISRYHEHRRYPLEGVRGFLTGAGGTTNALGAGSAGMELGVGRYLFWGQGGGVRTSDYSAPGTGPIFNSRSQIVNGGGGFGWYGDRTFFSVEAKMDRVNNGTPFAHEFHGHHDHGHMHGEEEEMHGDEEEMHGEEEAHGGGHLERIELTGRREAYRANWGLRDIEGPIQEFKLRLSQVDWKHDENEYFEGGGQHLGTQFTNSQFTYRGTFEQRQRGPLGGRFGIWGVNRDFAATGEEALTPPIDQSGLAFFALEELDYERFKLQFGARVEMRRYRSAYKSRDVHTEHEDEHEDEHEGEHEGEHEHEHGHATEVGSAPDAVDRAFTGTSAAVGIHARTWRGGAFVANFSHSFRAPAIEELYTFGPHAGTRTFDIGDPHLKPERGNGVDLSLRQGDGRIRGEVNFFHYDFRSFVFPFAPGEQVDGLLQVEYTQRNARFTGTEASLSIGLVRPLRLNLGMDQVHARDSNTGISLPRIPPLRGKLGVDLRAGRFRLAPELLLASEQNRTFTGETRTPGYAVMNLRASYTYASDHVTHLFSATVFNIGDRLYRNHSSFIKDLAPEIGRGIRLTYTARFF